MAKIHEFFLSYQFPIMSLLLLHWFLQYSIILGIVIILVIAGAIFGYVRRDEVRFMVFYNVCNCYYILFYFISAHDWNKPYLLNEYSDIHTVYCMCIQFTTVHRILHFFMYATIWKWLFGHGMCMSVSVSLSVCICPQSSY